MSEYYVRTKARMKDLAEWTQSHTIHSIHGTHSSTVTFYAHVDI